LVVQDLLYQVRFGNRNNVGIKFVVRGGVKKRYELILTCNRGDFPANRGIIREFQIEYQEKVFREQGIEFP